MIHHFDHRWATFGNDAGGDEEGARDTTAFEKADPAFEPIPRYWFPEGEANIRVSRVPSALKRALREADALRCLKSLAEWLTGYIAIVEGRSAREDDLLRTLGRSNDWRLALGVAPERFVREPKTIAAGLKAQSETPLTRADCVFLSESASDPLDLVASLVEFKQPRWLLGWRDITNATNERTLIASVFPKLPMGNTAPLIFTSERADQVVSLIAMLCSLTLDFVARQKVGGTHMSVGHLQQFPVLPPSAFSSAEYEFLNSRVLELTYTSHAMRPWAEDIGYAGPPFAWDETRRALLRAELDAFIALKYGLVRDEFRYVLDPSDMKGADYPSETFRVLKNREEGRLGSTARAA